MMSDDNKNAAYFTNELSQQPGT